jgi:hypothetical protein
MDQEIRYVLQDWKNFSQYRHSPEHSKTGLVKYQARTWPVNQDGQWYTGMHESFETCLYILYDGTWYLKLVTCQPANAYIIEVDAWVLDNLCLLIKHV